MRIRGSADYLFGDLTLNEKKNNFLLFSFINNENNECNWYRFVGGFFCGSLSEYKNTAKMGFVCDSAKKELARCCLALSDVKFCLLHLAETIFSTFFS